MLSHIYLSSSQYFAVPLCNSILLLNYDPNTYEFHFHVSLLYRCPCESEGFTACYFLFTLFARLSIYYLVGGQRKQS